MPTLRHILAAPDGAGLYRLASRAPAAAIAARARERGWLPLVLDGAAVRGKADFLAASAAALAFPAYFGHNWDALAECLTDLAWLESRPRLLLYDRAEPFLRADPAAWSVAAAILAEAVDHWRSAPTPLTVLLRGPRRRLGGLADGEVRIQKSEIRS
ncbi:MAG TPA: barstar family protein [Herpetosiphonaceae bacterium]|nr:barstar family protein [Herpetosiphonaceae bacterium]